MPRKQVTEKLIYKFDELSERAKEKARDWYREGALDYEWWDSVYEDAKAIGLKIKGFNLGRGSKVDGQFTKSADDVARLILKEHGEDTETYKDAEAFLADIDEKFARETREDDEASYEDVVENNEEEFLKTLLEDYRIILQKEEEYLLSKEVVDESIEGNDYEFNEDGSRA